ncbi:hypothetical protein M3Y99_00771200 [Aphelenchoides fujianensis]|nr:hypothetical protein M3Y99_00771200 [Aphelenchoides fujianensis]
MAEIEAIEWAPPSPPVRPRRVRRADSRDFCEKRFGMSGVSIGRLLAVALTAIVLLGALCLLVAAVITPAWQTVAEFQAEHQHGLWMDCTLSRRYLQGMLNDLQCTYKFETAFYQTNDFSDSSVHAEEEQHKFHGWHRAVLAFLGTGFFAGVIALCFLFCAPCVRICAIVANVFLLLTAVCLAVGMGVFFINSHQHAVRYVHGITSTYEQSKGYSFYLGVASFICSAFAFLLSIPSTVLVFLHDRQQHRPRPHKTFPKDQPISV